MNAVVSNIHSTNRLLSKCFLCLYGCAIHTLPILWNINFLTCITMQFHCIPQSYVLCITNITSKRCLQYASVLQAGIIFQAINCLYFFTSQTKRTALAESVIKHTFTTTHNMKLLHILCMSDNFNCLLWHYSPTAYYLLQCWFSFLNDIETEIKSKIAVSNKCYYALGPILKRSISQSNIIRLYKTIIKPTAIYAAETWTLSSKIEKNINDMGEKDIEENIWTNKGEWTVEN